MQIRRITALEGALLRRVRLAALMDAPSAFSSTLDVEARRTDAEWNQRAVAGSSGCDRATFFAEVDDEVVGLVGGYRPEVSPTTVEMVSMWVAPDARRSGVGAGLVEAVRAWAIETGASSIWLGVIHGNDAAQRLYRSAGFAEQGTVEPLAADSARAEVRMELPLT